MATYYIATPANGGNDANPGTFASPWGTWAKLGQSGLLQPGDIVNIRGGIYRSGTIATDTVLLSWNYIIGTAGNRITIQNYLNEIPIMDWDDVLHTGSTLGLYMIGCEYLTVKGLRFRGLFQNPNHNSVSAVNADQCVNVTYDTCTVYDIGGYAFFGGSSNNMTWKNCDAYNLYDPYNITPIAYNGSTGFNYSATTASGITTYDGCRVWNTSDNGFQFFNCTIGTKVIIKNCWAFDIGFQENQSTVSTGDGIPFKLGPNGTDEPTVYKFEITNCIAANSTGYGFDPNANSNRCLYKIYNCLAIGQNFTGSGLGFGFGYWSNSLTQPEIKNNIAINNTTNIQGTDINGVTNSWTTGFTPVANTADFTSLSSTQLKAARQADGSLPDITSFKLVGGSDLINAGTNVGLPFNGAAPDLGAFETGGGGNISPTANAGVDASIVLPVNAITLVGSGSDSDGTIVSYAWTQISGTAATIASPSASTTNITGLTISGPRVFRLTVTDNLGAVGTDDITITVNQNVGIMAKHLLRMGVIASSQTVVVSPCLNYDVTTMADISSNFNFVTQSAYTVGTILNAAGTKMIMTASDGGQLYVYSITGGNVSTATYDGTTPLTGGSGSVNDMCFSADGTKFYTNTNANKVDQFNLSVPYNLSTKTFIASYTYTTQSTNSHGMSVSSDGTNR
jgi:hypothetical protein